MPGHAFMGRPAARLEMMALVIHSYVLVSNVVKRRWLYPYGCNLLIYVIRRPCSLDKLITRNRTIVQASDMLGDCFAKCHSCSKKLHLQAYLEMLWSETGYFGL